MSKRQPSRSAVRLIPPTMASPSMTVTGTSRLTNSKAAVRPAGPAPMTTTCGLSATMLLNLHRDSTSRGTSSRVGSRRRPSSAAPPILPDTMRLDAPPATCVLPTVQIRDVARFRLQPLAMPSVSAYARTAGAADGARRTWAKSQRQGLSGRVSAALVQPDLRGALALALPEGADQSVGGELVGDPLRRRAPGRRDVGRVAADEHVVDQPSAVRAR